MAAAEAAPSFFPEAAMTLRPRLSKPHYLSPLLGSLLAGVQLTLDMFPAHLGDHASCLLLEGTTSNQACPTSPSRP